jgi:hypothetical protein
MAAEHRRDLDADSSPFPRRDDPREIVAEIERLREEFGRFPRGTVAFHVGLNVLADELLVLQHYFSEWANEHGALIEDVSWIDTLATAPQHTAPLDELERLARETGEETG